jgi:tetratricopeptide (TPR) repeat protein
MPIVALILTFAAALMSITQLAAQGVSAPVTAQHAPPPSTAPETAFLGVRVNDVTRDEAAKLGWASPKGAKLVAPVPGGPAAKAGLQPGDIILSMDGQEIANYRDFLSQLRTKPLGAQIALRILRDKQEITIAVPLISSTEALQEMERVLAADPKSIPPRLSKAELLMRFGRHADALTDCEEVLKLAPGDGYGHYCRARTLLALNRLDEALNDLNAAVEKLTRLEGPLISRADFFRRRKQFDMAIADLSRALALNERNASALAIRGDCYLAKGLIDPATADFNAALAIDKNNQLATKGLEAAKARTAKAVIPETSPGSTPSAPGHARVGATPSSPGTTQTPSQSASDQINIDPKLKAEIEQFRAKGDFKQALAAVDRAIGERQPHAGLHNLKGTILLSSGDTNNAIAAFERAIALQSKFADAHRNRIAARLLFLRQPQQALANCEEFVRELPDLALPYALRGEVQRQQGKLPEAKADFELAMTKDAKFVGAWIGRGQIYLHGKDYDKSIADFTRAIELDTKSDEAYSLRGKAYIAQGKTELAIAEMQKSLSINKTNWVALTTLQGLQVAKALEQLGQVKATQR